MIAKNIHNYLGERVLASIADEIPQFVMFEDILNVEIYPTHFLKLLSDSGFNVNQLKKIVSSGEIAY